MVQDLFSCLKSFIAVADYKSFASAARHTHLSAPVLTKQIKWLEKYIGKRLFQRTTRRVSLTEAGELYLDYARKIIAEEQEAKNAICNIETEPHGLITLGLPYKLNAVFFIKSLADFLTRYPKIKCRVLVENTPAAVIENVTDIVISTFNTTDSQLIKECLFTASTAIFASPDYIKKHGAPHNLEELRQHNCLINTLFSPNGIWKFAQGRKVQVTGSYESDIGSDIAIAAINGIGLAYLIKILMEKEIAAKELVEIPLDYEPLPIAIYMYYRPVPSSSIIRLLTKHFMQTIAF